MPWQEMTPMSLRQEFVQLALADGANVRELCRRYRISPKTGYKWLARHREEGVPGLVDRSRRPEQSPRRTSAEVEARVLALRDTAPTWGGRKLRRRLQDLGLGAEVPSPATITAILRRQGRLGAAPASTHIWKRFEHPTPNALWQMDFMGHHPLVQGRVHPLTVLDDHSRFALALVACPHEQQLAVQEQLIACFERYGLPERILTDNGPPWGASGADGVTALEVWLIRLGIAVSHGRPYHPQTQGKVERFHRTIGADVFGTRRFSDLVSCQRAFDSFRSTYNLERPHAALDLAVPVSRYAPCSRACPPSLPPIEYAPDDAVRLVNAHGVISFRHQRHFISGGLAGLPVAVRPTSTDGRFSVHFLHRMIRFIDLRTTI
jgi:transposase InsO family protein